jgi:hypothetical protein
MADISLVGSSVSQPQASAAIIRPPERVESERREAKDSTVERAEVDRSEDARQTRNNREAFAQEKQDNRRAVIEDAGQNLDIVA